MSRKNLVVALALAWLVAPLPAAAAAKIEKDAKNSGPPKILWLLAKISGFGENFEFQ